MMVVGRPIAMNLLETLSTPRSWQHMFYWLFIRSFSGMWPRRDCRLFLDLRCTSVEGCAYATAIFTKTVQQNVRCFMATHREIEALHR